MSAAGNGKEDAPRPDVAGETCGVISSFGVACALPRHHNSPHGNAEGDLTWEPVYVGDLRRQAKDWRDEADWGLELLRRVADSSDGWANGMDPDLYDDVQEFVRTAQPTPDPGGVSIPKEAGS